MRGNRSAALKIALIFLALPSLCGGAWLAYRAHERSQCDPDVVKADYRLSQRWRDQVELARSTPRMTLAGPVSELQKLRRELSESPATPCLQVARATRLEAMEATIQGLLAFMQHDSAAAEERSEAARKAETTADTLLTAQRRQMFPEEVQREEEEALAKEKAVRAKADAAEAEKNRAWEDEKKRIDQMVPDEDGPEGLVPTVTGVMRNGPQVVIVGSVKNNTSRDDVAIVDATLFLNGRPVEKAKVRVSVPAGETRGWSQPFFSRVSGGEKWTATATVD